MLSKTAPRICCSFLNLTATPSLSPQCLRFITTASPQLPPIANQRPQHRLQPLIPSINQPSARSTSTSTTATTSPTLPPSSNPDGPLTWNNYLRLRRKRRHYNLLASVSTSMITTAAGITFLSSQNFDVLNIFGLDPFLMLGGATAISGAVGWLLGPFVGNAVFGIVYRQIRGAIVAKDKDFYARIKRHRVDPSGQSVRNPVPDYYGEKIGSVAEFRRWMKDQRAYNKKRLNSL